MFSYYEQYRRARLEVSIRCGDGILHRHARVGYPRRDIWQPEN
jgi:hypothetical protein